MGQMSVRDVRQRWPEAEKALARDGEVVVTRDGKPVARLVPYEATARVRPRFDPSAHQQWLRRFWSGKPPQPSTDELLLQDREDG